MGHPAIVMHQHFWVEIDAPSRSKNETEVNIIVLLCFILLDAIDQIPESFEALYKRTVETRRKGRLGFLCPLVFDGVVFDRAAELIAK